MRVWYWFWRSVLIPAGVAARTRSNMGHMGALSLFWIVELRIIVYKLHHIYMYNICGSHRQKMYTVLFSETLTDKVITLQSQIRWYKK